MLKLARFVAPTVLFLEDLDLFAKDREASGWMGLGELMNQLDGAIDNEDLITIATTNRLQVVEDALRNRPGRFDRVLTLDEMDEGCRRRLLGRMLARAIGSAEDMDHLVAATKGCTGAQIEELANTLYILAVDRSGDSVGGGDGGGSADPLEGGNGDGIGSNDITAAPVAIDRGLIDLALEEVRGDTGPRMGFRVA
jgi:ATP-dependent 26S proteasome regulatory subunit